MSPQLSEHVLVTLLRQCFIRPSCGHSRLRGKVQYHSTTRALCSSHAPSRPVPRHRRAAGCSYSKTAISEEVGSSSQINGISSGARQEGYHSSSVLAARQNTGRGGGRQTKLPDDYAIIGGGITGLSAAHFLAKELPNAKITIYEGSERLGGWLRSTRVEVGNGNIVLEQGPRTLRASNVAGMCTLEMIQDLGLVDQLLITSMDSDAARSRFLYYPDHLVLMPGKGQPISDILWRMWSEPVFKGLLPGAAMEWSRDPRPDDLEDESVASFLERRLGTPNVGNNIVSAVLHGIYAGDIYQLSAKSLMPKQWHLESRCGSLLRAMTQSMREGGAEVMPLKDANLKSEIVTKLDQSLLRSMRHASVYSFKDGIGQLTSALEKSLKAKANVHFRLKETISSVEYNAEKDGITIKTSNSDKPPATYSKAISTISGRTLSTLVSDALPSLSQTHAVTVMVVNLFFTDPNVLPERGFGYLIPRSIPYDQNPECALGVVFDSDAVSGQDTATGTKVTVMIGGHWWDGYESYPDEEEGAAMAKAVLKRHLKIDEEPAVVNVGLQRECIPQYTVGHQARMGSAHTELMDAFKGKLAVAGNTYAGVGLNDCVRSAREVVAQIKLGMGTTGLDRINEDIWVTSKMPTRAEYQAMKDSGQS